MKKSALAFRVGFLGVVMLAALGVIVARLWWVQIVMGSEYAAKIQGGSHVTVRLPAVRGEIMDRNGIPLVQNRSSFEIDLYLPDIEKAYKSEHGNLPLRAEKLRIPVRGMLQDHDEVDIAKVVNTTIMKQLQALDLEEDYNAERMQVHYRNTKGLIPFPYRQNIDDFDTIARFLEWNIGLPGVKAEVKPIRHYVYGSMAAHILGYVGAPVDIDKERQREADAGKVYSFYQPDTEGKAQIEFFMNDYLRGEPGVRILQRDAKGRILDKDVQLIPPKQGDNVYLTLDARLQYLAEQSLRAVGRGAVVVVDPNNGDVLAMASVPSYDPNKFVPSISGKDWAALREDDTIPLLNRAINAYAPGSTYKILIALAGLRAGIGQRSFPCAGGISIGEKFMLCWKPSGHGTLQLQDAIKMSCNGFFYRYGIAAGIDNISHVGNLLGLGQMSGIPLTGEASGELPSKEWLSQRYPNDRWRDGYTANTAIGQGFVLVTPLQMAMVAATVANGGVAYYPRLIDKVMSQDGNIVLQEPAKVRADLTKDAGITPAQIEVVRRGMWKVVNEDGGTARRARVPDVEVAGKTGTAEFAFRGTKDNRVWFIGFAPYEKPRYAVCVMVEGGKAGGLVAAPIVGKILEEAFGLEKPDAEPIQLVALEPAVGHAKHIAEVNFGREVPAALGTDGETSSQTMESPTAMAAAQRARLAEPNIRSEPDAAGRVRTEKKKENRGLLNNFFNMFGGGKKKADREPGEGQRNQRRPSSGR
jgi:penicillin-binding protein 2